MNATSGATVDLAVIKQMMDDSLGVLTGEADPVSALESLLPGIDASKKIAIKVNCLQPYVPTRWEMVKGIVDRLCEMLGGTYPPGNITIYDYLWGGTSIFDCGFVASNFPGVVLTNDPASQGSGTQIEVAPGVHVELSSHIVNCDYFINCPVLKDHHQSDKRWTLGFKNHIGSVYPVTCHTPDPRLLSISASPQLKEKTRLVVNSCIHGIWAGGPQGPAGSWSLFPEKSTPNLVMLSTDPVAAEHWGIELINRERAARGYTVYSLPYCENAAGPPYDLGIYDFSGHEVITAVPAPASLTTHRSGPAGVQLQWTAVTGAAKYRVYRCTDPFFKPDPWNGSNLLAETTFLSYTDPAGAGDPATNHYYVVRAYRACWESGDSPRAGAFAFET